MLRLIAFLLAIAALATGLSWLADRPGLIVVNWQGYEAEVTVFHAVVALAILTGLAVFLWSLTRQIWLSPAALGGYFNKRRHKRGLEALSSGIIAIGAGDRSSATRYAIQARKSLPHEPLTHLLRAQAAQLSGDRATARRIYEGMLAAPDTEVLGLRGLFLEAQHEGEREAARQFAERAMRLNPALGWPAEALFDIQCRDGDWAGALETLAVARKHGHVEKASAERRRAVLLTAQAQRAEDGDPERALGLALEAHGLASDLVPAAAIAGRILAARGNTPKAAKVLQRTWLRAPHPDLATAYAYARIGDSPRDRLDRVRQLAALAPNVIESPIAVAKVAIEAREYDVARSALEPLLDGRMTQRVATLMARIEGEAGDKGRVREWLARAVSAPRDPAWTADGVVADQWAPISPVTGALDAFQWRVPVEGGETREGDLLADKLEELIALGAPVKDVTPQATAVAAETRPAKVAPAATPARVAPRTEDVEPVTADAAPRPTAAETAAVAATTTRAAPSQPAPAPAIVVPVVGAAPSEPAPSAASAETKPEAPASPATPTAVVRLPRADTVAAGDTPATSGTPADQETRKPPAVILAHDASARATGEQAQRKSGEPKIFVPPRAPDDPGTEPADADDLPARMPTYRKSS
ncbi:MAG: heme biosynthesis HemY N-terminal domain-containing protein [Pseudomonadota bacterium]